jgi:tetrahydromethanopterin S-methyltransferase subunit G
MKKTYLITIGIGIIATGILSLYMSGVGGGMIRQLGAVVGMYAGVEPNQYNLLAQQLDERSRELDAREAELAQQEVLIKETVGQERTSIVYATAIGFLLLLLVLLNFYLDWKRNRSV